MRVRTNKVEMNTFYFLGIEIGTNYPRVRLKAPLCLTE